MKQIIYDYLKRHWGVVIFISFSFLLLGIILPELQRVALNMICAMSVMLSVLKSDLPTGLARVALSLPLAAKQIGRAFWWICVGLPALSLTFLTALGAILRIHNIKGIYDISGIWLQTATMGSLSFGAVFWLFSGAPAKPSKNWKQGLPGQIYSYGFFGALIGGGYLLYKYSLNYETKLIIAASFCGILTVFGWLRAEGLVVDCGGYRFQGIDSGRPKETTKPETGYGGIPFLTIFLGTRFIGMTILIAAISFCISFFARHRIDWRDTAQRIPQYEIYFFLWVLLTIMPIMLHLKFLRTLPLTSKQLAAILLSLILLPILIYGGIIALIISPEAGMAKSLSLFKTYVLSLAPASVLMTAFFGQGEKHLKRIMIAAIIFITTMIPVIYQLTTGIYNSGYKDAPAWLVISFPLATSILAWFMLSHLLEKNTMTYRIQPQDFNQVFGQSARNL